MDESNGFIFDHVTDNLCNTIKYNKYDLYME